MALLRLLSPLAASVLMAACAPAGGGPDSGKGDDLVSCEGAALDDQQVCRLPNGTFVADRCCDSEFGEDGTFDDQSGIGCIFGDHLVMMARMADLDVSEAVTIDIGSAIDGIVLAQVLDTSEPKATSLKDALDQTDDGKMDLLQVRDKAHRRNFNMYVWSAGDNTVGRIYYAGSLRRAAEIGDGSILSCDAGYSNFDVLPFFYTH